MGEPIRLPGAGTPASTTPQPGDIRIRTNTEDGTTTATCYHAETNSESPSIFPGAQGSPEWCVNNMPEADYTEIFPVPGTP